jgi:hypothetical protein
MTEIIVEEYYKKQAKELTDLLFDKRFLNDDLSRESVNWLDDYIGFVLQTQVNSAVKASKLMASMRERVNE